MRVTSEPRERDDLQGSSNDEEGRVEIYTEVIPNCKAITLRPIILGKVDLDESILYSDGWRAYDGLVDVESERHFRVNHGDHEFSR